MTVTKKSTYVLGSTEWWKNQKHNLGHTILKLALYVTIFFLIWEIMSPLMIFGGIYSWWREQKTTIDDKNSLNNCFSFANLAYYEHFPLYGWIGKWILPQPKTIESQGQADLLFFLIKNFANGMVPGGSLTGKSLCQSIVPDWPPPPSLVSKYKSCILATQTWDGHEWPSPGNDGLSIWRIIVYLWGGMGYCGTSDTDACSPNVTAIPGSSLGPCSPQPVGGVKGSCGSQYTWIASGTRGSNLWMGNFLYQAYQIPYNCPMIVGFVSRYSDICSTSVRTSNQVLQILLGYSEEVVSGGGWWGAIQYLSSTDERTSLFDLHTFFWEGVALSKGGGANVNDTKPSAKCSGGVATGITTGIGAAAGVGMAGAMMIPEGAGACLGITAATWGWGAPACGAIIAGVAALGVGAVSGMNAAGKAGCCSGIGEPQCCETTPNSCPTTGKSAGGCIAMSQIVEIKNNGNCLIENIKPGDYIKDINGDWDLIYMISEHKEIYKILNIYFENTLIKLTPEHLIYKNNRLIKAETVKNGDDIDGHIVQKIETTFEKVRNPVTISGSMMLDDIPISCHNHSEKHAKKIQDLADCFDFKKLSDHIGSELVNEIANEMYKKLKNKKLKIKN